MQAVPEFGGEGGEVGEVVELRGLREVQVEVAQLGALLRQVLQHLQEGRESMGEKEVAPKGGSIVPQTETEKYLISNLISTIKPLPKYLH